MQGLHSPSLHTQRQLKEALYNQIIDYFDQGKVSMAVRPGSPPQPTQPAGAGQSHGKPGSPATAASCSEPPASAQPTHPPRCCGGAALR